MRVERETIIVPTGARVEFLDITKKVVDVLGKLSIRNGFLLLNTLHTTAALFINEYQEALIYDLHGLMEKIVQRKSDYHHNDPRYSDCDRENADSHLRSALFNQTLCLALQDGHPVLGQFQSIIFAELDGPRERTLHLQVMGE